MATTPYRLDAFTVNPTKANDPLATKTMLSAIEKVMKADTFGRTSSLGDNWAARAQLSKKYSSSGSEPERRKELYKNVKKNPKPKCIKV